MKRDAGSTTEVMPSSGSTLHLNSSLPLVPQPRFCSFCYQQVSSQNFETVSWRCNAVRVSEWDGPIRWSVLTNANIRAVYKFSPSLYVMIMFTFLANRFLRQNTDFAFLLFWKFRKYYYFGTEILISVPCLYETQYASNTDSSINILKYVWFTVVNSRVFRVLL
jgi:hypothetical protein